MRRTVLGAGMGLFLVAIFCLPVRGDTPNEPGSATPGALNYVEGQVSIGGQSLDEKSIGRAFDRHQRLAPDVPGGEGLGLSIVQRICEHSGWQVQAHRHPQGMRFMLVFGAQT